MINREVTRTILNTTETTGDTRSLQGSALAFALGGSDKFYVGFPGRFNNRFFKPGVPNTNTTVLSVKTWDGTAFVAVSDLIDETKCFSKNGWVHWENRTDWVKKKQSPVDDKDLFWAEFSIGGGGGGSTAATASIDGAGGSPVQATASIDDGTAGIPNDGELVTIVAGTTTYVFEFDTDASVGAGNFPVDIGALTSAADVLEALQVVMNDEIDSNDLTSSFDGGNGTINMTAGASFSGTSGNAPNVTVGQTGSGFDIIDFSGGSSGSSLPADGDIVNIAVDVSGPILVFTFEFDDNASTGPTSIPVNIGTSLQDSLDNLQAAIDANIPSADITTLGSTGSILLTAGVNFPGISGNTELQSNAVGNGVITVTGTDPSNFFQGGLAGGGGGGLSAGTTMEAVLNLFSDDNDLRIYYPELVTDARFLPKNRTDFLEQHEAAKNEVVVRLKQRRLIMFEYQILDINSVNIAAIHACAKIIYAGMDGSEEILALMNQAKDEFDEQINQTRLNVDQNEDGVISEAEKRDVSTQTFVERR